MIAKLTGTVDTVGEDWAVIDVQGVGYLVYCSARTLGHLAPGAGASVHVETHVREDQIALYGFRDPAEQAWFRLLTGVQGVGARVALAILGVQPPESLSHAVAAGDKAALTRAAGVGPRLANRILGELKDKAATIDLGGAPDQAVVPEGAAGGAAPAGGVSEEAVSALVNLGYGRTEAFGAVARVARAAGGDAAAETLIRDALRELAPGEQA